MIIYVYTQDINMMLAPVHRQAQLDQEGPNAGVEQLEFSVISIGNSMDFGIYNHIFISK